MMHMVEPIIIWFEDKQWTHPSIVDICEEYKDKDQINAACEVWTGPWLRVELVDVETLQSIHMVCVMVEGFDDFVDTVFDKFNEAKTEESVKQEYLEELYNWVTISLGEDTWGPGGEQFLYTAFGSYLNEKFNVFGNNVAVSFVSPDVGIHEDGPGEWGFST